MPSIFSVREINSEGERLSQGDIDRLIQKGFKKVEGGYIINLYDLGKKEKREVSKQSNYYRKATEKELQAIQPLEPQT